VRPSIAALLVAVLYVLHQDFWFWRTARPLVFGALPVGLFYHAAFTVACAAVLFLLVTRLWPAHLESAPERKIARTPELKLERTPELKLGPTAGPTTAPKGPPEA